MSRDKKNYNKQQNHFGLSRRDFIKKAGVIAGGTAVGTSVIGAGITVASTPEKAVINDTPRKKDEKWDFEIPPQPIPESEIKEIIKADVVVIGAGIGGLCASLSAAQAGARTILLEKTKSIAVHGGWNGAVGSRLQKQKGFKIDRDEIIAEFMRWGSFKTDQRLITLWVEKSGEVMDWVLDQADKAGLIYDLEPDPRKDQHTYLHYQTAHIFTSQNKPTPTNLNLLLMLKDNAEKNGVNIQYKTPAEQLIRNNNGRVTGVIAKTENGYKRFDADNIILCTGGYQNNPDMLAKYIPEALNAKICWTFPKSMTGDGHKMAMWIGASMEEAPHCPMFWDGGIPHTHMIPLTRQPWLNVNNKGERFVNEDAPFGYTARADMRQPNHEKWVIWDDNWEKDVKKFGGIACERIEKEGAMSFHNPKTVEGLIKKGIILKEDTLEALIKKMGVPQDRLMAEIKRYNELAKLGKDLDFGKKGYMMTAIEKSPFYAVKSGVSLVVTSSGLEVNTKLQVLDKDGNPIPGLYASGDTTGGFFANDYPNILGASNGRALTFGRLAGLNAASERS